MDKKLCVFRFAQAQVPVNLSELPFKPVKTVNEFIRGYKMHDIACQYIESQYLRLGFTLYRLGVDLRGRRIMVKNELPDYLMERAYDVFCVDAKSKRSISSFGKVNARAVVSYLNLKRECGVPVYLDFVRVHNGEVREIGYSDVVAEPIQKNLEWNGNVVWVYKWERGLAKL